MNQTLIKYPDTGQFKNVIREISTRAAYAGRDAEGNAIYDNSKPKPTITFQGTVKLHGTNASVVVTKDSVYAQSRERVITTEEDNAGFARYVKENEEVFRELANPIINRDNSFANHNVVFYGEWVGKGVQKGVGISEIDKSLFLFGVKLAGVDPDQPEVDYSCWVEPGVVKNNSDIRFFNITDYQTWEIDIDFNNPEKVVNDLIVLTERVAEKCPVALRHGVEGHGEGIVWTGFHDGHCYRFKVKSEKFNTTNGSGKALAPVDTEKLESVEKFVEFAVTTTRVLQACESVRNGKLRVMDNSDLGAVIKWVMGDINKENSDVLEASGLTMKDISGKAANAVKSIFFGSIA